MTPTPDPALAARLLELSVKSTQDPLNEDGRYFNGDWHEDLTQCIHGDTGNYSNKRDGQFIAELWNAYRSGQLITLADHTAAVQAAVAKAVEAERAGCAMILDMDACDLEEDALKFRAGTNPSALRRERAETLRKYSAAIRARKGDAL